MAPSSQPVKAPVSGFYYYFFGLLEPISTLAGAAAGWTNTLHFFHDQIPSTTTPIDLDPRANMVVWQLASCYLLLAMISFTFFQSLRRVVADVASQEYMARQFLTCLALADLIQFVLVTPLYSPYLRLFSSCPFPLAALW
ncbi:hypothetical protein FRB94_013447 [Tulasnella sp. JGI-2019a]|nr:hypothetical protein FRB93_002296 [Tulasnella sp. JGI-2019a]KAG9008285.1 hypothetical protein FRB94_013447 [Tulasnella sp. JGI-2019a]KAG9032726.1 hypothetical protein FRB95_001062 [Tulasnella sp. JGI-2019a]